MKDSKEKETGPEKIEASEYGAASIPRDELMAAYRYFKWKESGAQGEQPPALQFAQGLFPRGLPPKLIYDAWEDAGSFKAWVRKRIEATHKFRNAVVHCCVQGIFPGLDPELDKAFAEYQRYCEDLSNALRIAKEACRDVLKDEGSRRIGFEEGSAQFKPLWKEWKEAEGRYAKAKRKCERAERELAKAERELEELRRTASQRVAAEREFIIRCRNFARTYCREKENNASAAAEELMKQDWFIAGIMVHTGRWWPRSKKDYAGKPTLENPTMCNPWKRRVQGNLGKAIMRWRTAGWILPFDADDAGGDLVTRMCT